MWPPERKHGKKLTTHDIRKTQHNHNSSLSVRAQASLKYYSRSCKGINCRKNISNSTETLNTSQLFFSYHLYIHLKCHGQVCYYAIKYHKNVSLSFFNKYSSMSCNFLSQIIQGLDQFMNHLKSSSFSSRNNTFTQQILQIPFVFCCIWNVMEKSFTMTLTFLKVVCVLG